MPHVHVHLIPRLPTDFEGDNDRIYPALEQNEAELNFAMVSGTSGTSGTSGSGWRVPKDEDRKPRGMDEMQAEAEWMAALFIQAPSQWA